jgi:hypothetical protein
MLETETEEVMSHNQKTKALVKRAEAEARDRANRPGDVMVTFRTPQNPRPWYRPWRKRDDYVRLFPNAHHKILPANTCAILSIVQPDHALGQVETRFDWDDVEKVTAILAPKPKDSGVR